jgi:hypothetical protein
VNVFLQGRMNAGFIHAAFSRRTIPARATPCPGTFSGAGQRDNKITKSETPVSRPP